MQIRLLAAALGAATALTVGGVAPAFGYEGGHPGGCADFGHVNGEIARGEVTVPGFEGANLGEIVSSFAHDPNGRGVGDVVEDVDHQACGQP